MNIEEEGKTYIKIKDRQEKSIIERNKVLEKLSKLEPLKKEDLKTAGKTYDELNDMVVRLRTDNFILQQENKQLKERFERLVQEHIDTINRNEEKQQRIDKAIGYIGNHKQRLERLDKQGAYFSTIEMRLCDELLNILKDKENE